MTQSFPHKYELTIERKNVKTGRPLSTLTPMKSDDRDAVQAEFDRRSEMGQRAGSHMQIRERKTHAEAAAERQQRRTPQD